MRTSVGLTVRSVSNWLPFYIFIRHRQRYPKQAHLAIEYNPNDSTKMKPRNRTIALDPTLSSISPPTGMQTRLLLLVSISRFLIVIHYRRE
jgi:hypothetical protein